MDNGKSEMLIYQGEGKQTGIEVRLEDETVWLSQKQMAELFQTTVPNINMHITNIFKEGELHETGTIKDYLIVGSEGTRKVSRSVAHYNLDLIISALHNGRILARPVVRVEVSLCNYAAANCGSIPNS